MEKLYYYISGCLDMGERLLDVLDSINESDNEEECDCSECTMSDECDMRDEGSEYHTHVITNNEKIAKNIADLIKNIKTEEDK